MKYILSKISIKNLNNELNKLKLIDKPRIIKELINARSLGDLSENAEYHSAKTLKLNIEKRIEEIENILCNYERLDSINIINKNKIALSAIVELKNIEKNNIIKYKIVSNEEINTKLGLISIDCPIAKLLIGKSVNDIIILNRFNKNKKFKIISIKYE